MNTQNTPKSAKIPFDSLTLRAVVCELQAHLPGGQVQEVRQPEPTELWLAIRNHGKNYYLTVSADARFARVHLTKASRKNAPTPPTFCMAVRKHLDGGSVLSIRQRDFDRIFEMQVETRNEEGSLETYTLLAELMGKHSNLILLDSAGRIVDAAKRISNRINRVRQTLPSLPYQPPPQPSGLYDPFARNALDPLLEELRVAPEVDAGTLSKLLLERYVGMSPFLARELSYLPSRPPSLKGKEVTQPLAFVERSHDNVQTDITLPITREEAIEYLKQRWETIMVSASSERYEPTEILLPNGRLAAYPFPTVQLPEEQQKSVSELNTALDKVYQQEVEWAEFEAVASDLRSRMDQEIKRLEKQKQSVERTIQESHRAEEYKQAGELLLANLWQIETGMESINVQDYYSPDQSDRSIPLDIKLTPQENANAYFRRFRKARDGQENALERGIEIESHLQRLDEAREKLDTLQQQGVKATTAIRDLQQRLLLARLLRELETEREEQKQRGGPDFAGHKISRVTTPEGYEILIGETATANDYLTTRLAGSNDIWLHVRAAASAHVVIRTHGKPEAVPRSVLEQAALLCARHSSQKHSSLVPVDYTLKKYVRKPRGAAPGSVLIQQEKTLHVTPG